MITRMQDFVGTSITLRSGSKTVPIVVPTGNLSEATEALMVLGYDKNSVAKALEGLDPKCDVGELVRLALKTFAK